MMRRCVLTVSVWLLLAGCEQPQTDATETPPPPAPDFGEVLVWVADEPIYEADVDHFLSARLNLLPFQMRDQAVRHKVLESLIAARAMAQAAERDLSEGQRVELEMQIRFYREEMLTKQYLEENAQPMPVSDEMVRRYYEDHPDEFGERKLREIEWLATIEGLESSDRQALLPRFQELDGYSDWEGCATRFNGAGVRAEYKRGVFSGDLLGTRIRTIVETTPVGETSGLHMIDGRLHRIRVLSEKDQPAQPLSEVRGEIRKRLAPIAMRDSVRRASEQVVASAAIRYPEPVNEEP